MKSLLDRLLAGEILVGDGATGSTLIAHGLQPGQCPEAITLEEPDVIAAIAREYLEAGAELLTTNTFGASPLKLADYGREDDAEEINGSAAAILREVAAGKAYISASCGPSGRILEPYGDTSEEEVYASFERQMSAFAEADVICVETMSDLREASLAVRAAKALHPDMPVMATMTFDETPRGFYTIMGTSVADAAAGLLEAGADVVGSNCGNGLEKMIKIAGDFRAVTSAPILIQSNAGQPVLDKGAIHYPEGPDFFAEHTPDMIAAGTSIIGGCCGTTPDHIRAVRKVIQ